MTNQTIEWIKYLTNIPSPTGNTSQIIKNIKKIITKLGYDTYENNKGSLIITVKGKDYKKHRLVTAHVDTLGAMVRAINP